MKKINYCLLPLACCLSFISNANSQTSECIVEVTKPGAVVADICRGQQLEEFNHQFQGGLYAQLISNPSFEELDNPIAQWYVMDTGYSKGEISAQTASETAMLNSNQQHCIKFSVKSVESGEVGLANGGYWGIKLDNFIKYTVSFWARADENFKGSLRIQLEGRDGTVYAQSSRFNPGREWKHYTQELFTKGVLRPDANNRLVIYASSAGDVYFDVFTLMPPTWKNRPNGLRIDLAQKLADLKFKYIQFPGGCTAESADMEKCWNWKNSIGPLEERAGDTRNRWKYKNDLYFGLDEYLQLCEDLGAEPVYTCSAGISETPASKEWYALCPLDKMQPIIDDILDLIEYCNGSASTKWGAKRAANGHPQPYNLKYIEIGNENGWETEKEYNPRYSMIRDAIIARFPEMKIMYNGARQRNILSHTSGLPVDYTDEHFYLKDLSTLYSKYDTIDPACKKICVAEYASSVKGNGGNVIGNYGDALGDAVFMLGCEKNSERIWWTGYGNYAGVVAHSNFGPCIVWNDAVDCFATPSYYMQKMLFTDNQGSRVLPFTQNTKNCFWSASIDTKGGKNDVLLKVVNKSTTPETVSITLAGAGKVARRGHATKMLGALEDENSFGNPTNIVPFKTTFRARRTFKYNFPPNSIALLRIEMKK